MSRLNDVSAMVDRPSRAGGSISRSVRKIDNGYVVCDSSYDDKTGVGRHSEVYSKDAPGAEGGESRGGVGNESLADVKKYLGSDV